MRRQVKATSESCLYVHIVFGWLCIWGNDYHYTFQWKKNMRHLEGNLSRRQYTSMLNITISSTQVPSYTYNKDIKVVKLQSAFFSILGPLCSVRHTAPGHWGHSTIQNCLQARTSRFSMTFPAKEHWLPTGSSASAPQHLSWWKLPTSSSHFRWSAP